MEQDDHTTKRRRADIHIHPQFGGGFAAFLVEGAEQFSPGFFGSTRERAEAHARECAERAGYYELGETIYSDELRGIGVRREAKKVGDLTDEEWASLYLGKGKNLDELTEEEQIDFGNRLGYISKLPGLPEDIRKMIARKDPKPS